MSCSYVVETARSERGLPRFGRLIWNVCMLGFAYWVVGGALLLQSWRGDLIVTYLLVLYPVVAGADLLVSVLAVRKRSPLLRRGGIVLECIIGFTLIELGVGSYDLNRDRGVPNPFPPLISPRQMISGYRTLVNEVLVQGGHAEERGADSRRDRKTVDGTIGKSKAIESEQSRATNWVCVASIGVPDAPKAGRALRSAGIESVMGGSLGFGVDVQEPYREEALRVLEHDARTHGYWIRLYREPTPRASAKKDTQSLGLELKFPEPISTPDKAEFIVTLTNRSAQPILVLNYPSPDRGFYVECRDEQGRAISMQSGPVPSVPAIRLEDLVVLRPGHGRTTRLRWATHFRDSTPGGGRIRMSFIYTTGDFPRVVSKRGAKVWRGRVRSNWVALEVQPKTGLPSGGRLRVLDAAH